MAYNFNQPDCLFQSFHEALKCSGVKLRTVATHFQKPELKNDDGFQQADEMLKKQILGFLLSCCTSKYGISKRKGTPKGFPNLMLLSELVSGAADLEVYGEVFAFLVQQPKQIIYTPMGNG